jgi:hypothetical protein
VPNSQCLQDGIFFLHTTKDVFCRYSPQSRVRRSRRASLLG